ncbi:TadE/TadG family type IV pilus assembly protein [Rhodoplanes sp. Z2-YC6860]|uniref:TadE/TadG family type IV pilus assembly protein n=1 Tax=Rhodoplanes sp. Z2-YC6860 TaxID=674703 RepID=UPI00078DD500|nr:TadE/TadG family type IV pilus assembly protein [Rhodoplanes sp. Z2-YC6860]AMN45100.1 Flp pilus assembly protein TadG [Rhodoplanes sp. Z2-YC6860]
MTLIKTRLQSFVDRLSRRVAGLASNERGIAAVEFAMLLPLMLTLWLGTTEISTGIAANRKVTLTARTLADLTSQVTGLSTSDMTNSLNAAAAVISPYNAGNLKATVSSVSIDANNKATIAWSVTKNGTAHAVGSSVTLPSALLIANSCLIWSEVQYAYKPTIGYVVTGTLQLKDQIYMRPRLSNCVTYPTS